MVKGCLDLAVKTKVRKTSYLGLKWLEWLWLWLKQKTLVLQLGKDCRPCLKGINYYCQQEKEQCLSCSASNNVILLRV